MGGREIKSMLLKSNDRILSDGTCSNCHAVVVSVEDGKIFIKTRIERIDPETGKVQYKCRNADCRKWLDSPFYKIDLRI